MQTISIIFNKYFVRFNMVYHCFSLNKGIYLNGRQRRFLIGWHFFGNKDFGSPQKGRSLVGI